MKILVVNAGSSSLKYQLLDMKDESVIAKGNCDRIGIDGHVSAKTGDGRHIEEDCNFPTHTEALKSSLRYSHQAKQRSSTLCLRYQPLVTE